MKNIFGTHLRKQGLLAHAHPRTPQRTRFSQADKGITRWCRRHGVLKDEPGVSRRKHRDHFNARFVRGSCGPIRPTPKHHRAAQPTYHPPPQTCQSWLDRRAPQRRSRRRRHHLRRRVRNDDVHTDSRIRRSPIRAPSPARDTGLGIASTVTSPPPCAPMTSSLHSPSPRTNLLTSSASPALTAPRPPDARVSTTHRWRCIPFAKRSKNAHLREALLPRGPTCAQWGIAQDRTHSCAQRASLHAQRDEPQPKLTSRPLRAQHRTRIRACRAPGRHQRPRLYPTVRVRRKSVSAAHTTQQTRAQSAQPVQQEQRCASHQH